MEHNSGRFLLSGSADGTVAIYDISKWGSGDPKRPSNSRQQRQSFLYHPVQQSLKVPYPSNILQIPDGHSSSITYTQWYPTDAGVFLTASADSTLLVWDTARMKPVLRVNPFGTPGPHNEEYQAATWMSCELRSTKNNKSQEHHHHTLLVAGSYTHSTLKLVDIRSGAASHELVGHHAGISCVNWSPLNGNILASGSRDGCIRMWDVRKSGSRSCITVLDRNSTKSNLEKLKGPSSKRGNYSLDYSHLRQDHFSARHVYDKKTNKISKKRRLDAIAPNSYDHLQNSGSDLSHHGRVASLKFMDGGRHLASVGGKDGELILWDLTKGTLMPNKYLAPGLLQAATPNTKHTALLVMGGNVNSEEDDGTTTSVWVANKFEILGFGAQGGTPKQQLRGHLSHVTALERMEPGSKLLSGGEDGMILCWGQPPAAVTVGRSMATEQEDEDNW
ncbi:MAG: hypothetical protein SGILL_003376 [Bacillariaceae sp.]